VKAIVLVSGGLDSATVLAVARADGCDVTALTFRYGQRHAAELACAAALLRSSGVPQVVVDIDLRAFGGSALTSDSIEVPSVRSEGIPVTYVPARNTIFLSFALACAEARGAERIDIGANAVDYSGYPDCRPEYVAAFQTMADLATRAGVEGRGPRINAPLMHMTKAEIIRAGVALGVDYAATSSCYAPHSDGSACGVCDSCVIRRRGFADAGVVDPTRYGVTS
jgi:7-cyano-7-deazaguanine synthase